jgi:uncharacterized membrane protein
MTLPTWLQPIFTYFHPLLMWVLFAIALYALHLGLQVRRLRSASSATRKELIKQNVKSKHYQVGSLLLALMVVGAIGGIGVTYVNNGKLFVQPHLIAGLSMAGLIAITASLAPFMQAGKSWARQAHIALSLFILGLFGWEAVTGMQIVQRIMNQS